MKDIVVLIPGITGSVLAKDGKEVWAPTPGAALAAALSLGGSIKKLQLDGDDPDADDLGDGVVAPRLVPDLHVLPGLDWKIDGYTRVRNELVERFGAVPGENYFEFPYDWRRDNRVAARRLARLSRDWLAAWREKSGNSDAKLILVGHSMGGIVARLYLEMLDGWRDTKSLVTFGTPYSGSVNALEFLVNGFRKGWGPLSIDLGDLIRSFTSIYQLLPSYRCVEGPAGSWLNLDDPSIDWAGTALDGTRMRDAVTLHRQLRARVDERLQTDEPGYDIRSVIGDFQRTRWAARFDGTAIESVFTMGPDKSLGDGTVPKVSAIPHEAMDGWRNATFVGQRHASLQNDDAVINHLGGLLTAADFTGPDVFPADYLAVSLEVDDVTTMEPMVVRAKVKGGGAALTATVEGASGKRSQVPLHGDGWQEATIEGLAAQDYRITVHGDGVRPVTDVASVVDLAEVEHSVGI
ncbi:conserved hypothetical protein [Rhodococcus sp. RD6.2]|uniref:lipase/acyltransferase domain-containing protein n=1 Tax=Rhodococcus sp. RD6.2 TaxID=260936 RepID=UPI00063B5300|nr:hypothetical protein [Rhodococcus sp. RD6.2]CRK50565.1 conserved hypothetical protein [Rhodococcus sp. RD6.2]